MSKKKKNKNKKKYGVKQPRRTHERALTEVDLLEVGSSSEVPDVASGDAGEVSADVVATVSVGGAEEESVAAEKEKDSGRRSEEAIELPEDGEAGGEKDINKEAEQPKKVQEVAPRSERRRYKMAPWIWWLIGVLLLVLIVGGAVWMLHGNSDVGLSASEEAEGENGDDGDESDGREDDGSDVEGGDKRGSVEAESGTETEPESELEKPVEEKPAEQPSVTPEPIAPRPETSAGPVVATGKVVALTFDDGPSRVTTPRLLDILKGRGVKATFFVLGNMALASPDIVKREAAEGHQVASHTPYHHQLTLYTEAQVRAEAVEMDRIFTEILGTLPAFTRPPYGSYDAKVGAALGQPMILWSVDPRDWQDRDASVVCSRVVNATFDGAIILVHDIHATTVDAVPCIIDSLKAQGYEFLTVSELAAFRDVPLVNGAAYRSF